MAKEYAKSLKYSQRRFAENGTNHKVVLEKWGLRRRYSWGYDGKDEELVQNERNRREDIKEGLEFSKINLNHTDDF